MNLQPSGLEDWCENEGARSLRLVTAALDLLDERQRDVPKEKRIYRSEDIIRASVEVDTDSGKGVKRSTLRRNLGVIGRLAEVRGIQPEPEPDFGPFGAHRIVCNTSEQSKKKRRTKLAKMNRADLAYWVVGYQELARHWNHVRSLIEAVDWTAGRWPEGIEFPSPPFEVASSTGHRYHQLGTRETIDMLKQTILNLQEQVSEDLRIVEDLQRRYINQQLS